MPKQLHSPAKKSHKKEEREYQQVLHSLETEKRALIATPSQAAGVAFIPISLHATDTSFFLSYIVYFVIGVGISAALLSLSYNQVADKSRKTLFIRRSNEVDKDDPNQFDSLVKHVNNESSSYALFTVNLSFLVGFLFFALYFLRPYSIPSQFHYIVATALPSAITYGLSKFY